MELVGRPAHEIRALGLARTFQTRELFGRMSLLDNMLAAMHTRLRARWVDAVAGRRATREEERAGPRAGGGDPRRCSRGGSRPSAGPSRRPRCPSRTGAGWRSRWRSPPSPGSCWWTSRPPGSIRTSGSRSWRRSRAIRARGYTILLVEHNMRVVTGVSDRIVVFDRGRKIADGPPGRGDAGPRRHRGVPRHGVRRCLRCGGSGGVWAAGGPSRDRPRGAARRGGLPSWQQRRWEDHARERDPGAGPGHRRDGRPSSISASRAGRPIGSSATASRSCPRMARSSRA